MQIITSTENFQIVQCRKANAHGTHAIELDGQEVTRQHGADRALTLAEKWEATDGLVERIRATRQADAETRATRQAEQATPAQTAQPTAPAAEAATGRQVDYIMSLLAGHDGTGFMTGPTTRQGVAAMTRREASAYITSLKADY